MRTAIHVGHEGDMAPAVREAGDVIVAILVAAAESRTEQQTIRTALETLGRLTTIQNISLNNCSIQGDTRNELVDITDDPFDEDDEDEDA